MRLIYLGTFLILAVLLASRYATAEIRAGWAYLAAEHKNFPAKECAAYGRLDNNPFMAVLPDTFGVSRKCIRNFMKASKGKPTGWLYYMGNGSGRRKKLYPYEFLHRLSASEYNQKLCSGHRGTKNAVISQARKLRKRCNRYAHNKAECLIALELESQFTECAAKKMVNYVKQGGWHAKQIIHNPVNIGPYQGRGNAHYLERHWVFNKPAEKNYHLGVDGGCADHCHTGGGCGITGRRVSDADIKEWYSRYKEREDQILTLWCPEHQGLYKNSGGAPEPRRRDIRVTRYSVNGGNNLIGNNVGPTPPPAGDHDLRRCDVVREFRGCNVAKESDHGGFVAVMADKLNNARLVTPKGRKYKLRYTGTANPCNGKPRHHYRHSKQFHTFPDNMTLKGKVKNKTECFKLYEAGRRHP